MKVSVLAARPVLRAVVRLDRTQISYVTALRNAVGVVVPLLVGSGTGQLLAGLAVSLGALQVAFSDRPGPYRLRVGGMLLVSLASAVSVFVGGATGALSGLAVLLAAAWGFGAGLLVALGQVATQIGLASVVLLVVFGARPSDPAHAAIQAGLVLSGGALQTALAVAAWPIRPFGPQRAALAAVFRRLAAFTRTPSDAFSAPPATEEITAARTAVSVLDSASNEAAEMLRALLDGAERIRLELLTLDDARLRAGETTNDALAGRMDSVLTAAGNVLAVLAEALTNGGSPFDADQSLRRIEEVARALQPRAAQPARTAVAVAHIEALAGQLRAALENVAYSGSRGAEIAAGVEAARPPALRLRAPLAILRANLTLRSPAGRHAVRLACVVAVADGLTRVLALPRAYWVPMTVAIVLKPDFTATFSRGLVRMAGTALGLGLATLLVHVVFGDVAARIVLLGLLMVVMRSLGAANHGLFVIALTGLVVILTSFAGVQPEAVIAERGIDTALGGVLALIAYVVWPTWERAQTAALLAAMLEAYRAYFAAVIVGYQQPGHYDSTRLAATRLAARLARTNVEASIARLRDEPARATESLDRAIGVLANSHRFVHSVMALEAGLYHQSMPPGPPALHVFARDVETTLDALARALRDSAYQLDGLPSLRADQRAFADDDPEESPQAEAANGAGRLRAALAGEADRITDSVNTMITVLRRAPDSAIARPGHDPAR